MYFVRHVIYLYVSLTVLVVVAFGASPVGKVTSSEPFQLRGAQVPVAGVSSWPLMAGDEIGTSNAPAAIQFRDGSRVTLSDKTKAKVEQDGDKLVFRLLAGAMQFTLAQNATVKFYNNKQALQAAPLVATTARTANLSAPIRFIGRPTTMGRTPTPPPPGVPPPVSNR